MNTAKTILAAIATASCTSFATTPVVSNVTMAQSASSRLVTISYALDSEAVVTLDIQTNNTQGAWVSIGGAAISGTQTGRTSGPAQGDVWKVVPAGNGTITWRPDYMWPDHVIGDGGARAVVTAWALDNPPDYMVADLADATVRYYPGADFLPGGLLDNEDYRKTKLVLRKIMAKDIEWTKGGNSTEPGWKVIDAIPGEPQYTAQIANNYYIGVFEVTQTQYEMVMGSNPSAFKNADYKAMRPVDSVSYNALRGSGVNYPTAPAGTSFFGKLRTWFGNAYAFVEPDPESPSGQLRRRFDLSVSPPRLVFFAGCRDVRVEGVTVVNPPAGWSFWVHDCDRVRFADMAVASDVNFPNNDGIHVNCSRDVEIVRCRIETGDDSIVVRANSASLRENRPCERVRVADCSLRSYSCGVRIGWLNDGVIRDCSFERLDIRDSVCGIGVFLPDWHSRDTWPDQGREATDISDMEFTDIRMDAVCARPVYVHISGHSGTKVRSVRGLWFRNVVARGLMHPVVSAPRPGLVSDISFVDCRFTREPASPERYPNGGNVGFAQCQRFPDDIPDANVENIRRTRTTLA